MKGGIGDTCQTSDRDRRTFNIQTILVASRKRRADSSTKSSNHFREYVRKIFPTQYAGQTHSFLQRNQRYSIEEIERNDKISVVVSIPHFQNSRFVQFLSNINQHVSMYIQCSLLALADHNTCSKSLLHGSMQLRATQSTLEAHSKYTQNTLRVQGICRDKQISLPFSFLLVGLSTAWGPEQILQIC